MHIRAMAFVICSIRFDLGPDESSLNAKMHMRIIPSAAHMVRNPIGIRKRILRISK